MLKLPIDTYDDLDKEYQRNYELLKGQFLSGNNSPEVKAALRKYNASGELIWAYNFSSSVANESYEILETDSEIRNRR